jgi:Mrp family chromosome partitioning ATPase
MADLISWTDESYDQILIDCPPMLAASDAAIVGHLVDAVILVVRPEENPRRAVLRAAGSLASMAINVAGVVANFMGDGKNGGYYGYGSEYGYGYGDDEDDAIDEPATQRFVAPVRRDQNQPAPTHRRRAS